MKNWQRKVKTVSSCSVSKMSVVIGIFLDQIHIAKGKKLYKTGLSNSVLCFTALLGICGVEHYQKN